MTRTDPLRLDAREPATQPRFWPSGPLIPSQLHRETEALQERREREARKDRETGSLFGGGR